MLISLLTLIIAIAVALIGAQNHRLARDRFRLDLFDKRFAVYKGVQRLLTHVLREGSMDDLSPLWDFRRDTQDAIFLFGADIEKYIDSIDSRALEMHTTGKRYAALPTGEERSRLVEEETRLSKGLMDELPKLRQVFAPYLKFEKWK